MLRPMRTFPVVKNSIPKLLVPVLATLVVASCFAPALFAASPPCSPCAGIRVADPAAFYDELAAEPALEGEARLYVAWATVLDGSADPADFEAIRQQGGTPWLVTHFRSPAPILEHLDALEVELADLSRLARGAGPRAHLQITWDVDGTPEDFAFLLKRAAVTITGAGGQARVIVGPLPSDETYLRTLYGEEIAAYVDGLALAPGPGLEAAIATLAELDTGKPLVLDGVAWPEPASRTLARAAEAAAQGFGVTLFDLAERRDADLAPLKLLAREFQGDISFDPYTVPTGPQAAWTFVRGEDLALRVIAESAEAVPQLQLYFDDAQLRSPQRIDLASGASDTIYQQRRTQKGLVVTVDQAAPVELVTLERMSAAELEGVEERVEVADERQMPVEEILRRLQAFEDDQNRRVDHYQSRNTFHLRFLLGQGAASIEASYEGAFFFEKDKGFDWAWETLYVDGVKWKGKKLPELPLIQPERAAALPIEIYLDKEYSYRLRGTGRVGERDCWVIDFEPVTIIPGRSLYQGTVWVDREIYARVKTRTLQLGLEGEVISNEETTFFEPVDAVGQGATWSADNYIMPTRVVGQQLLSLLNATVPVEIETTVSNLRINGQDFVANRETAWESDSTMVRDTEEGMRYLIKDEGGERVVQEEVDTDRFFIVGGVFYDETVDFPIPLAGINYLALDWKDTGNQVNLFFAGPLVTANIAEPRLFDSKWDAGANAFGFFIRRGDQLFRAGNEVPGEEVESATGQVSLFLGRPLGSFGKLDFTYSARYDDYADADDTDPSFVIPQSTLTHTFLTELSYNRSGWRFNLQGSFSQRTDWEFWGLPGNTEFDPEQEEYIRWKASLAKTFWLPKFRKIGIEIEHLDGEDLDRFSSYDFGIFGDSSVGGYPSGLVRAEEANGIHLDYGISLGELFRIEVEGDAVWATNEATGLDNELLAGIGLEGTVTLPWQMLANFEIGQAIEGPADGIAARVVFLKLFGQKGKKKKKD